MARHRPPPAPGTSPEDRRAPVPVPVTGITPRTQSAQVATRVRRGRKAAADRVLFVLGTGLGLSVALAVSDVHRATLALPGGYLNAVGRVTGLVGAYLLLVMVVLVSRLAPLERALGQDRLLRWHRRLAPWPMSLIVAHVVTTTLGYAQAASTGVWRQLWLLIDGLPNMLAAVAGFALLVLAMVTSWRVARRHLKYETWWALHLYFYLGLALSFAHEVTVGADFTGHPAARWWWTGAWAATLGAVAFYRLLVPVWRTLQHRLRVVDVYDEGPGVISVVVQGRHVERLQVDGGQFLQWRFLRRGLWWQAHPYSLSAMPQPPHLRITVKALGDHSADLPRIRPGTLVAIEGPYGTFTKHARSSDRVALVGAGVGVTPLRALVEDLPTGVDVVALLRASNHHDVVLAREMKALLESRRGHFWALVGSRSDVKFDAPTLERMVPDLEHRDVFVCGPHGFTRQVVKASRALGVDRDRIHVEDFVT
ncbi:MAG TPA: ferredoxin reductase family protein [Acidimicrobiales bacterium]|nr:ferredoxin reductase family protein [Acidimicrobiales bacterium]